ncbi:MAG: DUF4248 domain-containing protein [Prevotellaceae bacterium]|jgi:hypothetical protein|nr:DUF4248 domain-containing protein [Prevotellaceae bacterium]
MKNSISSADGSFFPIRRYGKGELASLYMPDILCSSALRQFNEWLATAPGLTDRLRATGLQPGARQYTPQQVSLIVEALGEP